MPNSHEFSHDPLAGLLRVKKCFTALSERAKQNSLGVCSALSGLRICGFPTWGVARGSCRVALPQADLFRPFGAMPESSRQSKASSRNPALHASAG
jgi:hypothetical protein